jgi:hypothetical protein
MADGLVVGDTGAPIGDLYQFQGFKRHVDIFFDRRFIGAENDQYHFPVEFP